MRTSKIKKRRTGDFRIAFISEDSSLLHGVGESIESVWCLPALSLTILSLRHQHTVFGQLDKLQCPFDAM